MRQRAEWDGAQPFGGCGASHLSTPVISFGEQLVCKAGFTYAARTVNHEAVRPRIGESRTEQADLVGSAHQRPLQGDNLVRK
jgi:hypothetical protein